jgi:DNA polymerase-1
MLRILLEECGKRIIGQNFITFDTFILGMSGFDPIKIVRNIYLDTMEAFGLLEPELPKSLAFLTSIFTNECFYKSEGKHWGHKEGEDEFWTYGCKDVCYVHEIAPQLEEELKEENLWDFYQERYIKVGEQRVRMSMKGLKEDLKKKDEIAKEMSYKVIKAQSKLTLLAGKSINVKSTPVMRELLYGTMKLPPQWKDGHVTCDEDALLRLSAKHPSKIFEHIITVRHYRTLWSNNIEAKLDSDGRIRTAYGNTETGRFTSSKTALHTGTNLQNWEKSMRAMIVPDTDEDIFLEPDFSQAEARVVAWKGRMYETIELFLSGKDIHKETAVVIFVKVVDEITGEERYVAKRIRHAINYDMHPPKFAAVYNKDAVELGYPFIDIPTAKGHIEKFHEMSPGLKKNYQKELAEEVSRTKTLFNVFGRRMRFHDRIGQDLFRAAYGWYAQSTVGDLTNTVLMKAKEKLQDKGRCFIAHQMHDGLLVQCKRKDVEDTASEILKMSKIPLDICGDKNVEPLVIPMEFKKGDDWYNLEEFEVAA